MTDVMLGYAMVRVCHGSREEWATHAALATADLKFASAQAVAVIRARSSFQAVTVLENVLKCT